MKRKLLITILLVSGPAYAQSVEAPAQCRATLETTVQARDGSVEIIVIGDSTLLRAHTASGVFVAGTDTAQASGWAAYALTLPLPEGGDSVSRAGVELRSGGLPTVFAVVRTADSGFKWWLSNTIWVRQLNFDPGSYSSLVQALAHPAGLNPSRWCTGRVSLGEWMARFPVDRPAELHRRTLTPRFPPALRAAGVNNATAAVVVFVDARGRADLTSVEIRSYTHPEFAKELAVALRTARFRPAVFEGAPVGLWVELAIGMTTGTLRVTQ